MQPSVPCSRTSSRKKRAANRLPWSRPCMSGKARTTVSISPLVDEGAQLLDGERGCAVCHGKVLLGSAGSHKVLRRTIDWEGGTADVAHGRGHRRGRRPPADDRLTPVLRPVRAGNGFEEALEQILQVVRLGLVPGGERLPVGAGAGRPPRHQPGHAARGPEGARRTRAWSSRGAGGTAARSSAPRPEAAGEDELRRRVGGRRRRGRAAVPRGPGGRRGRALRGARPDRRAGATGCARRSPRPTTRRWPTTAAWTPCCT